MRMGLLSRVMTPTAVSTLFIEQRRGLIKEVANVFKRFSCCLYLHQRSPIVDMLVCTSHGAVQWRAPWKFTLCSDLVWLSFVFRMIIGQRLSLYLTPKEKATGIRWMGRWVGLRAGLDVVVKRKIPILWPGSNPRSFQRCTTELSLLLTKFTTVHKRIP
jgi:hypothetical protein